MNKISQLLSPTAILSLFSFLLPWQTRYIFGLSYLSGDPTQFGVLSVYVTQLLVVVGLVVAYALHGLPRIRKDYRLAIQLGGLIVVFTCVSAYLAQHSIPALAAVIDLTAAAVVFAALLDDRVRLKSVMLAFVAGLLLPVGLGIAQIVLGATGASSWLGLAARNAEHLGDAVIMLNDSRVLRAYGTMPHPNNFGGYLAVGLLTALLLRGERSILGNQVWWKRGLSIIAVVLAIGLLLTASRSAALGLLLGGGLALLVFKLKRVEVARVAVIPIAAVVIGGALAVTLFAPQLATALRGGGELEERSLSERADQYREYPNTMHGTDWLIGNGPRNYIFAVAEEHPDKSIWDYQPIHNVPLLILAELGLIGALIVVSWSSTIDRLNFARFPNREAVYAFAMGNVILVILFFDHYLWSSWSGLALIAYVMALTARLSEKPLKLRE